ncbi:hypothetical protein SPONN_848 [uncultured Candidatus Thioglobus sp.]|nr:hypothetical protein SPONN_1405 [uncultured Candidatus Thioglobus sp.]SMM99669.1 hypothetical protein SPONN_848 [uncultured Candidatus Thioglobus sp.]
MNLVCFTEEQSAKVMLDIVLPKILPHLNLDGSNTSASFNILLSGVKKLCLI